MTDDGQLSPTNAQQAVATICDLFLDMSKRDHKPDTYSLHLYYLQDFCTRCGKLMVHELKPFHVTRWLDSHSKWKASRRHAIVILQRALNWAEEQGYITSNPIRKIKKPKVGKRLRVLTADERNQIRNQISDRAFREFVIALEETGCRPGEIAKVTAENVNTELGIWILYEHKTVQNTGKPRVVYLSPKMVEITQKLLHRNPTGPLFLNSRDKPFNRNSIRCRFRRIRAKLPELKPFTAYSYRHTYTTDALVNGVGIAQVAELLGHTSTDMVMRHYQHLSQKIGHMRSAAKQAIQPPDATTAKN